MKARLVPVCFKYGQDGEFHQQVEFIFYALALHRCQADAGGLHLAAVSCINCPFCLSTHRAYDVPIKRQYCIHQVSLSGGALTPGSKRVASVLGRSQLVNLCKQFLPGVSKAVNYQYIIFRCLCCIDSLHIGINVSKSSVFAGEMTISIKM